MKPSFLAACGLSISMLLGAPAASATMGDEASAISRIRAGLIDYLADPGAAQIEITKGPWRDSVTTFGHAQAGEFVCAKVNAKNAYGGYVGFRPFMFILRDDGTVAVWERSKLLEDLPAIYDAKCVAEQPDSPKTSL